MKKYYASPLFNMPSNFLEAETRCDFFVDEKRKKIWAVLLDIYLELKRVCDKYKLNMRLNGGSLLGAVRHNGFIPWDDDLDVALYRDDFEKLCEVAKDEFHNPYFFQYALSDRSFFIGYARLRRNDTTGLVKLQSDYIYNNGLYVDIYVYDKAPEDNKKMMKNLKKVDFYGDLLNNYYHIHPRHNDFSFVNLLRKRIMRRIFRFFVPYEKLYNKYKKISSKFNNSASNRLVFFCSSKFYYYEATMEGFAKSKKTKFEFIEAEIPSDYNFELTKAYGDYHVLPEVESRGKWHSSAVVFDPDTPYLDYIKLNRDIFEDVLKDLEMNERK